MNHLVSNDAKKHNSNHNAASSRINECVQSIIASTMEVSEKLMSILSLFQVDSAWIAYNKPKNPELANEYAGFLMALGLNGHLTKLATLNIHDNLNKVRTQDIKLTA